MFEIKIVRRFAAAHRLRGYRGQCEKVHGHTFKVVNPSSENLARYIYGELQSPVKKKGAKLKEVTVWESEDSAATYHPG
ncbi:MAG: 6-carboxytetrahydropterin synthase [Proteobacteria bacterium]|nr:6-carboxytetrahydropterin synthase [Pseudomonadota bacterium]